MPRLIALAVCAACLSLAAPAPSRAQTYGQVVTIGPWQPSPYGWLPNRATYYNPYQSGWAAGAYGGGYYGGSYYDRPIYDPAARELRRIRYAVEDAVYQPRAWRGR